LASFSIDLWLVGKKLDGSLAVDTGASGPNAVWELGFTGAT
jgi:hypothetical protein